MKASPRLFLILACISATLPGRQLAALCFDPLSGTEPEQATGAAGSNPEITLDAVVTNKSGKQQSGLQQQDFTLLDNKTPQKILSFQAVEEPNTPSHTPVEIVLVMDTVNAPPQTVSDERLQVQKYLRKNGGKLSHPTSVVIFSDSGMNNL